MRILLIALPLAGNFIFSDPYRETVFEVILEMTGLTLISGNKFWFKGISFPEFMKNWRGKMIQKTIG